MNNIHVFQYGNLLDIFETEIYYTICSVLIQSIKNY